MVDLKNRLNTFNTNDSKEKKCASPLIQDKELKNIPVIVISGIDGNHAIKNAVAFVKKPFDPEKIIGIIRNTIG